MIAGYGLIASGVGRNFRVALLRLTIIALLWLRRRSRFSLAAVIQGILIDDTVDVTDSAMNAAECHHVSIISSERDYHANTLTPGFVQLSNVIRSQPDNAFPILHHRQMIRQSHSGPFALLVRSTQTQGEETACYA